jgi:peptidoglycan/xylan/chitin deacetylase (PgdA/CDA1 family)
MTSLIHKIERGLARQWSFHTAESKLTRPIATFSFDDVPASAVETGAAILESRGVRGSYYVCGSLAGARYRDLDHFCPERLRALSSAGHEIGCHGFEHEPYPGMGVEAMTTSIARNAEFFAHELGGFKPASFAYPFGDLNFAIKRAASKLFPVLRGVKRGVNTGMMDFSELRANPLDRRWQDAVDPAQLIANAKARTGWLIFFTHDVQDNPTLEGCAPDHLKRVLDDVLEAGFEVVTLSAGAARVSSG